MVFIAIAIDFFSVGFAFQSYSVIQIQIENELQLSRFMTTLTLPIFMLCSALLYPVIGKLLDSFSTRDVLCVGGLIYAFSLISLYFTNTYLSFILVFALPIALGAGLLGNLSTSKLVSNWFNQKTGNSGNIKIVRTYTQGPIKCKDYNSTVDITNSWPLVGIGGVNRSMTFGTACQLPDGQWIEKP
jgi:MFS family permease